MPRAPRLLQPGYSYHVTIRCNNREFRLTRPECREVMVFVLGKAIAKFGFKLYALCIMSNHIHYLLEPRQPEDLPRIMHWLNWYSAMCFNRMLRRTGHFWEKRYHSTGFPTADSKRALNTLRYIHANPKSAGMQQGYLYDYSNYGTYDRLSDDGLTIWHPAFLQLGPTLEDCARRYRSFCKLYKPKPKGERQYPWGSKLLPKLVKGKTKTSPGQLRCPWAAWEATNPEIRKVAEKFVIANCYDPQFAARFFDDS